MEVHCTGREVDSRQLKVERIWKKKHKDNAETLSAQGSAESLKKNSQSVKEEERGTVRIGCPSQENTIASHELVECQSSGQFGFL